MLKLFFNRESKIVYAMEIVGIGLTAILIIEWWPSGKSVLEKCAFFFYILLYLLIRAFAILSWYDSDGKNRYFPPKFKTGSNQDLDRRYPGIELQFRKAMIPTSYILAVFSLSLLTGLPGWLLYIADVLMIVILHVNFILLYFHVKDKETLPVNYFTHNKYLKD